MSVPNVIQWYENKALDDPKLRSPTPCPRGVYCQYKLPNPETKELELACCRMVHPGEEGNGRRLFPARTAPDGRQQPACVRLTGKAGFYERCRLKQPWRMWAAEHEIPLPPADIPWVQVQRGPILRTPQEEVNEHSRRVMRMRFVPAGGGAYEDCPLAEEQQQARIDDVLARNEVARAMVAVSRAGREAREADAAKPVSAAPSSAADWPALPYRVPVPPPSIDLRAAVRNYSAAPSPMHCRLEAPSPQLPCGPPPRLALGGACAVNYGFNAADSLPSPPQIQRLRTERLYEEDEETGCATPRLVGSVHEDDGCASPCLLPFCSTVQRIDKKLEDLLSKGASLEEARQAATDAIHKEIMVQAAEGGMEAVD